MKMNKTIKNLVWDSSFFSKRIGSVIDINNINKEEFFNFELITNKVSSSNYRAIDQFYDCGFYLIEGEVVFEKKLVPKKNTGDLVDNFATRLDVALLKIIAEDSYINSRFRQPWFSEKERNNLYSVWVEKSVIGLFDDVCLIVKEGKKIKGFVTLKKSGVVLKVGLIAVEKNSRGAGISRQLLLMADEYGKMNKCEEIRVATQLSNISAINMYVRNGYKVNGTSYWLYKGAK